MKTLLIRIELDLQRVAAGNVVWVSESVSSDATDVLVRLIFTHPLTPPWDCHIHPET